MENSESDDIRSELFSKKFLLFLERLYLLQELIKMTYIKNLFYKIF